MYNPAEDPTVISGIQEAYGFRRGDVVEYTNSYGLTFGPHTVIGFVQKPDATPLPENAVYIDSDSPWYPVKPSSLRKMESDENDGSEQEETMSSVETVDREKEMSMNEKIYVAVFNHFGDWLKLANELGATVVDETLCFTGMNGQEISNLMEQYGLDYNYGSTPDKAREIDE